MEPEPYKSIGDDKFVVVVLFIIFFLIFLTRINAQSDNNNNTADKELSKEVSGYTITSDVNID